MTAVAVAVLATLTGAAFCWQAFLRRREGNWAIDFASVGVMVGFMGLGILYLGTVRSMDATVPLFWYYIPHAYNLVIWPALALLILRPRFGSPSFLIAFVFVYGLDELLWNAIAYVRFGGSQIVTAYMYTEYWMTFFAAVMAGILISYYMLRPVIVPNWTWLFLGGFVLVYAVIAGMPTYIDEPPSAYAYVYAWELMWQGAIWVAIYGTFFSRRTTRLGSSVEIQTPLPGGKRKTQAAVDWGPSD